MPPQNVDNVGNIANLSWEGSGNILPTCIVFNALLEFAEFLSFPVQKCGPLILLKLTEVLGGLHNLDGAPFGWLDFNGTPKLNGIDGIPNDC